MSDLFKYEQNIEREIAEFFTNNGIKAYATRGVIDIEHNNVQVALEYQGAIDTHRQLHNGFQEYDLHQGSVAIQIQTYRSEEFPHHDRVAKIRSMMLNGYNGLISNTYTIFDLMPEATTHAELAENNLDQTLLSFSIKWKVNFSNLTN